MIGRGCAERFLEALSGRQNTYDSSKKAWNVGVVFPASPQFPGLSLWSLCPAGDGGNDVSMIQESDCGVGVEGKVSRCTCGEASCCPVAAAHMSDGCVAGLEAALFY